MDIWIRHHELTGRRRAAGALLGLLILAAGGCAGTASRSTGVPKPRVAPVAAPAVRQPAASSSAVSVEGAPIATHVLGQGRRVILFLSTIHGNEPAGVHLLNELLRYLPDHPEFLTGWKVVVVPCANPDGFDRNRRTNVHGVDLNRNFPSANFRPGSRSGSAALSEPESRYLNRLLLTYRPERVITLHQPLNCMDYDGPAEDLARRMAQVCPLPVRKLRTFPGSLGAYAGDDLGIAVVTMEMPSAASQQDTQTLWRLYGQALLTALTYE
ncbi:MAG: DUF2817 domain-containing protein [Sedimentisphaerales bacterium]|nr:DUF2817 domain-containing protein [Sedimentisphaerales bacterium]